MLPSAAALKPPVRVASPVTPSVDNVLTAPVLPFTVKLLVSTVIPPSSAATPLAPKVPVIEVLSLNPSGPSLSLISPATLSVDPVATVPVNIVLPVTLSSPPTSMSPVIVAPPLVTIAPALLIVRAGAPVPVPMASAAAVPACFRLIAGYCPLFPATSIRLTYSVEVWSTPVIPA